MIIIITRTMIIMRTAINIILRRNKEVKNIFIATKRQKTRIT